MNRIDQREQSIQKILEEKKEIEKKIEELETYRAVVLYKLKLDELKKYEDILRQLDCARYSQEANRIYEPIHYGINPIGTKTGPENIKMKDHVSLETFLRSTLFYAYKAGKRVLSYQEVKDFYALVLEEFKKDVAYQDEPYRTLSSNIHVYLDPKENEIDFFHLNDVLFDEQNTAFIGDIAITRSGYLFFCPVVKDVDQLEKEVLCSSFKTQREKEVFTSKKVEDFFGITFDQEKQKVKAKNNKEVQ